MNNTERIFSLKVFERERDLQNRFYKNKFIVVAELSVVAYFSVAPLRIL